MLTSASSGFVETCVYDRSRLKPGARLDGPAIVEQADTTTVIEPGWQAHVDPSGSLILSVPN